MITLKDEIEQFKRDLKSYSYHQKKVREIEQELEVLTVKMQGVSSPAPKDVVLENAGNPYSSKKNKLLTKKGHLIKERNKHLSEIKRLDNLLQKCEQEDRDILVERFVRRFPLKKVAADHHLSKSSLLRHIDSVIKDITKK